MDWCTSISLIYGHLSMKWLKREILGHKKWFCLTNFCQKKCYAFFFSFLFCSFFLSFLLSSSSSSFFFFFIENGQCEKWFFNRVLVPLFAAKFLQYFSWQLKKKIKNGLSAYIPPSGKCESTYIYARGFVRQTFIYLFIHLIFFSTLGIT